jgi:hypothetical protein
MTTKQFTPLVATPEAYMRFEEMFRQSVERYEDSIKRAHELIESVGEGEITKGEFFLDRASEDVLGEALQMLINEYEDRIADLEKGIQDAQQSRLALG